MAEFGLSSHKSILDNLSVFIYTYLDLDIHINTLYVFYYLYQIFGHVYRINSSTFHKLHPNPQKKTCHQEHAVGFQFRLIFYYIVCIVGARVVSISLLALAMKLLKCGERLVTW